MLFRSLGKVNNDPSLLLWSILGVSQSRYLYGPEDEQNYVNQFTITDGGDGTLNIEKTPVTMNQTQNHLWKYNEDKILKDIQDYVTGTYNSHYCGHNQAYKDTQTIDLMAAKDLAAHFCQANILKYGSRYGDKDGRNKRDLLKVIHYAMLLLHFDGHYSRKDNGLAEFR